ncbi:MAG: radical SAM protein, partial [Clostridia bacterium]|nr:radical SAM protein [Clostridia bacterium]
MKDVIFITPTESPNLKDEIFGTLTLASLLKYADISVKIKRFFQFGDISDFDGFISKAEKDILSHKPKIVSFYTRCDVYHVMIKIAERIKTVSPETYIVFGGPQSDTCSEETMMAFDFVDYICCGEGEQTVVPFFKSLLDGTPNLSVDGLVYRKNGQIVANPRPALLSSFDDLPFVDFSLWTDIEREPKHVTILPIDAGRGCPFNCVFCSTKSFWERTYRLKSPDRIIEEIKLIYKTFKITRFKFMHDMFTMNKDSVSELCKKIKELDFKVVWSCSARLDCLSTELIDTMVDAGLKRIFVGVESGSPRMQKSIKKNLKIDKVNDTIKYLSDKGVQVEASFIYGFPDETPEDLSQTIYMILAISGHKGVQSWAHRCSFLPGTELERVYRNELTEVSVFTDTTGDFGATACAELINAHPKIFPQYREYNTPLRTSLRYFDYFLWILRKIPSVYMYLSRYYTPTTMLNMYYDWEKANIDLLENLDKTVLDKDVADYLLEN